MTAAAENLMLTQYQDRHKVHSALMLHRLLWHQPLQAVTQAMHTCGLLLMHVNGDAGLQVGTLNLGQLTTERDHHHITQNGLCLLHVFGHDGLVCPGQSQCCLQCRPKPLMSADVPGELCCK